MRTGSGEGAVSGAGAGAGTTIWWSVLEQGEWRLHLAATADGLCFVGSQNGGLEELAAWAKARVPDSELVRDDGRLRPYADELGDYLLGKLERFTVPCDLRGTAFQQAVWQALGAVPFGRTASYAEIAERIRRPSAARAVGAAIGANPVLIAVPCHRVIGKSGALTGYRGGLDMKTKLLALERGEAPAKPEDPA